MDVTREAGPPKQMGPLDGVRVLDLTYGAPGAVATMLLADYGAEVISVSGSPGDGGRPAMTSTWDRGKRSIAVDGDADVRLLEALASSADVVVVDDSGSLAGVIDLRALRESHPGVVCTSIVGGAEAVFWDALAGARRGVLDGAAGHRDGPKFLGHPAISYSIGLLALVGTLAAVHRRLQTGAGALVTVSDVDGVAAQSTMNWWSEEAESFVTERSATGQLDFGRRRLLLRTFAAADGELLQIHTGAVGAFDRLLDLVGLASDVSPSTDASGNPRLLDDSDLAALARLPSIFSTKPRDEWLTLLWTHQVAALPVLPPGRVFSDDQVEYAGMMVPVADPRLGRIEVVGPPIVLSSSPGRAGTRVSLADEDGPSIRQSGWSSTGLAAADAVGVAPPGGQNLPPLRDVKVLEFGSWFAAAYGNRVLADLGADVIKVEPASGDPMRTLPDPFLGANLGKRSVVLDLSLPRQRPAVEALLQWADVVQHNMRPGVAERLGVGREQVAAANGSAIYSYAPGYGSVGPKAHLQSFAPLLSGFVGIQHEVAGKGNAPHGAFGNEDYFNGLLNASAILLALLHRSRTGASQYVECPQLHSSLLVMSHWYLLGGVPASTMPELDADQYGWTPEHRIYQCLDGWIAVAAEQAESKRKLFEIVGADGDSSAPPADATARADALTYEFFGRTVDDWVARIAGAGIPCAAVEESDWFMRFLKDSPLEDGRVLAVTTSAGHRVRIPGDLVHFDGEAWRRERPAAPDLGADTASVLAQLGVAELDTRDLPL
jgi:crotonobetainyl-CoA:carnitine CoA-transferase CaiB-like acyl-CoA transferase